VPVIVPDPPLIVIPGVPQPPGLSRANRAPQPVAAPEQALEWTIHVATACALAVGLPMPNTEAKWIAAGVAVVTVMFVTVPPEFPYVSAEIGALLLLAYCVATFEASTVSVVEVQVAVVLALARQLAAARAAASAETCAMWRVWYQPATSIPSAAIPNIDPIAITMITRL
jgi:hypothetical protein